MYYLFYIFFKVFFSVKMRILYKANNRMKYTLICLYGTQENYKEVVHGEYDTKEEANKAGEQLLAAKRLALEIERPIKEGTTQGEMSREDINKYLDWLSMRQEAEELIGCEII